MTNILRKTLTRISKRYVTSQVLLQYELQLYLASQTWMQSELHIYLASQAWKQITVYKWESRFSQ
jgi:hypothetical protein